MKQEHRDEIKNEIVIPIAIVVIKEIFAWLFKKKDEEDKKRGGK